MADANPYDPAVTNHAVTAEQRSTLRDHPLRALLLSIILGTPSGLAVIVFTVIFGSHGGLPSVGYYVLGPPTWLSRLNVDEVPFIFTLGVATCFVWIAYWWFALVGTTRLPAAARLLALASLHALSVAFYQIVFGLP